MTAAVRVPRRCELRSLITLKSLVIIKIIRPTNYQYLLFNLDNAVVGRFAELEHDLRTVGVRTPEDAATGHHGSARCDGRGPS